MEARTIRDISSIFLCNFREFEVEITTLENIRAHDEYTYLHCLNVARLSVSLGKRLGIEGDHLTNLGWAALLHDIGKLGVPLSILNKVKKFTPEELEIMKSHPLESLTEFAKSTPVSLERLQRLSAAFEHHQRYDLQGYPIVQTKLTLHPFSRIVAIADTFDAMTTDRIYQRRVLPDVALKLMVQGFGTVFDPFVLQAFITCMGAYPVGTLIRLSTKGLCVVTHYNATSHMDRPFVYVLDTGEHINLMDPLHRELKILRSEFPEDHNVSISDVLESARKEFANP
jgi:HD-GYP domain-containing protein (c-di-GMP phosphodiesterase class II)